MGTTRNGGGAKCSTPVRPRPRPPKPPVENNENVHPLIRMVLKDFTRRVTQ